MTDRRTVASETRCGRERERERVGLRIIRTRDAVIYIQCYAHSGGEEGKGGRILICTFFLRFI